MLARQAGRNHRRLRAHLLERGARCKPANNVQPSVGSIGPRRRSEGNPEIARRKRRLRTHHANNRVRLPIEPDHAPDRAGIAAESALPQRVTDHDHGSRTTIEVFGRQKETPKRGAHPEDRRHRR